MAVLEGTVLYLYYAFFVLGSASFGYLVLRLGYPDVRLYGGKEKLGLSGILGGAIALIALGLDFAASKVAAYDFSAGFLPVFLLLVVSLVFLGVRLYFFYFSQSEYITVGIPIPAVPLPARVAEQLVTRVPPVHVPVLENAVEKTGAKPSAIPPSAPSVPVQKVESTQASAKEPFSLFPTKKPAAPQTQPSKPVGDENRLQRLMAAMNKKEEAPAKVEEKPAAIPQPAAAAKGIPFASKPAEIQKPSESPKPTPLQPQPAKEIPSPKPEEKPRSFFAPPWMKREAQKQVEAPVPAKPAPAVVSSIAPATPLAPGKPPAPIAQKPSFTGAIPPVPIKPKPAFAPQLPPAAKAPEKAVETVKKVEIEIPLKKEPEKPQVFPWYASPKKEETQLEPKAIQAQAVPPAPSPQAVAGKKPAPSAAEISLARKEAAPIERLKELKKEVNTGEAEQMIEIDVPLKKAGSTGAAAMQSVPAAKEEVKAELKKVREAEFEAVARDLGIIKEGEPATQAKQAPEGERMRRRYLARGEQSSVKVIASKSVSEKEEFGDLVQDVYSQLRATSTEDSLQSAMQVSRPQAKKPADVTMEDLFGEQKKPGEKTGAEQAEAPSSLFSQLNAINAGAPVAPAASAEEKEKKSSVEFVKIQAEKGMGCPTCHSKNTRIIFCPYCGTGMCANCSPKITPKQDTFIYVCPKCLEDVNVKKKSPTTPSATPMPLA